MYELHPNELLRQIFKSKPYQGVAPEDSDFLFIGLDANYAPDIDRQPIFSNLLNYHEDGAAFWRANGVHHPFLLPGYAGDGRRYHLNFAKIGFQSRHANLVSFVELLHEPTVGRNTLTPGDLSRPHLERIHHAIFAGNAKWVFVSSGVLRLMKASRVFPELMNPMAGSDEMRRLYRDDRRTVFLHLHFSNYGKFEQRLRSEAKAIAA
ncbi:MAG: hypothetical protein R3E87_21870 [Burkholderiaceae bacterium]